MAVLSGGAGEVRVRETRSRLAWSRASFSRAGKVLRLLLVAACSLMCAVQQAWAQSEQLTEYEIKAAFLYNFTKFIEWPPDAFANSGAPIVLGIVGQDPFGDSLVQMVAGKTLNGRGLVVKRVKEGHELRSCHILFVSSSEKKRLTQILESLKGSSVLTVGEMSRFGQSGGAINFVLQENKVRLEINAEAAARARLKISSKLLAVARIVAEDQHRGES